MTGETQKEQTATTLKKDLLNISQTFYQRNLRLLFLEWEPKCEDKIHMQFFQVQRDWSRRNISLPIEHASFFGFVFVNRLSGFHLFCVLVHKLRFALQY